MTPHPTPIDLDRLEMAALDAARVLEVRQHVETCSACHAKLALLRESREHFTADVLPRTLNRVVGAGPGRVPARRFRTSLWFVPLALTGALAAGFALVPRGAAEAPRPFQVKGASSFAVIARQGNRAFTVDENHHALPAGAQLRFVVHSDGLPYLLVASIDGAGRASTYFPYRGASSGRLDERAGRVELPGSITLDAAPGPERIFALFSRKPIAAAQVSAALQSLAERGWDGIRARTTLPVEAEAQMSSLIEKAGGGDEPARAAQ